MPEDEDDSIALHVIVVGFHHKKGMMVEYAYPPLSETDSCELPNFWHHLPSLCLPDGAHNHESDTVYFHLPHLTRPNRTIFGVSCYRQIDSEKVTNRTADITRNTVQKSVCVLSSLPIYGYIQERLQVTTKVYFKGADFSNVSDLEGLYHDLNTINWRDKLAHGICVSELVRLFGRNVLLLFKLLLLERRVLFFHSPVGPLVKAITSLLALLPDNISEGIMEAASRRSRRIVELKPVDGNFTVVYYAEEAAEYGTRSNEDFESKLSPAIHNGDSTIYNREQLTETFAITETSCPDRGQLKLPDLQRDSEPGKIINITSDDLKDVLEVSPTDELSPNSSLTTVTSAGSVMTPIDAPSTTTGLVTRVTSLKGRLSGAINYWTSGKEQKILERPSATATPHPSPSEPGDDDMPLSPTSGDPLYGDAMGSQSETVPNHSPPEMYAALVPAECGFPLQIFTKGNLVHPYLSLQYLDVLTSPTTRAFVVGASNALFVHKKSLYEVLVLLEGGKIEIRDPELRRYLNLSTEDLRFADNLVRQVEAVSATLGHGNGNDADVFLEGVGWMGGEEWLGHQFKIYLLSMLRSSLCPEGSPEYEVFNGSFMTAWKSCHNYRVWSSCGPHQPLMELFPGHPHSGHLSMADMRIKLSHTLQLFDKSRKLNQTLANTGTAVVRTKEAVGGAITSARGALTNLWSTITASAVESVVVETAVEAAREGDDEVDNESECNEERKMHLEEKIYHLGHLPEVHQI